MIDQHLRLNDNQSFLGQIFIKLMLIGSKKNQVWFQIKTDPYTLKCLEWRQQSIVTLKLKLIKVFLYSIGPHSDVFMIDRSDSEDHISNMKAENFQLKLHQKVTIGI